MSRKCTECGKMHGMVVENTTTGEVVKEIDKCYECLWKNWKPKFFTEQVVLNDEVDVEKLMASVEEVEKFLIDSKSVCESLSKENARLREKLNE